MTTPQVSAKTAPLWRRFAALIYDLFILVALSLGYSASVTFLYALIHGVDHAVNTPMFTSPLFLLGWFLTIMGFYCVFWRRFGQTIGMKTWHIKVYPTTENDIKQEKLSWQQTLLRSVYGGLSFTVLGAGYWYKWINKNGDCWHDHMSHTRVLHEKNSRK